MEALLRYALTKVVITILLIEFIIIIVCSIGIVLLRTFAKRKEQYNTWAKNQLSQIIMNEFTRKEPLKDIEIPKNLRNVRNMVETLESFEHRLTDSRWIQIKNIILDKYLLKYAKQHVHHYSWLKRQLAARCFLLNPERAEKNDLAILLQDPKFLVRVVAAVCITHTSHRDLFNAVIRKMSDETPLSRFSYRDALLQVDPEKFKWIEAFLKEEAKNPALAAICLDLLSTRTSHNLLALVMPFIYGSNQECRLLAVKILKNIPSKESIEILVHCLSDQDSEIRAEAIKNLASINAISTIHKIQLLLNDPIWFVRLQAALALKQLGDKGVAILSTQNPTVDPLAYEISQYVLALS